MALRQGLMMIVEKTTLNYIEFQFVQEELELKRSLNTENVLITGRNLPTNAHYASGENSLDLELAFFSLTDDKEDIQQKIDFLLGLTYSGTGQRSSNRVQLIWGDLYQDEEWYISGLKVRWEVFNPEKGYLPHYATARLTLEQIGNIRRRQAGATTALSSD